MIAQGRLALILKVLAAVLVVVLVVILGAGVYLYRLSLLLPDISVDPHATRTAQTSVVFAADGSVLATWHGEEDRTIVQLDSMPQDLRDAVVAIEDERFYTHNGVDTQAIVRALRANSGNGGISQGGSTITQQLVKILFTDGERTLSRKVREALLAYELESRADKDDVLQAYLNTVYFGHGSYGVESAAQRYFNTSASSLRLAQSATLAAVIQSPGRFSPINAPEEVVARRNLVLEKMREQGLITGEEERAAREEPLEIAEPKDIPAVAPYFVEYVKQQLIDTLGAEAVFEGGLRVYTTLDPVLQASAEKAGATVLGGSGDPEYAVVSIDYTTGHVVAMVGGRDFKTNQFNLAVQGKRQPGSAFKPFVLARALEEGVKPDQMFDASPYSVQVKDEVWNVRNYENQFAAGSMTLRAATNWSVNCVYARLIIQVGAGDVVDVARRMGIVSEIDPDPAIALGGLSKGVSPMEMASAFGTIANGGMHAAPLGIERVTDGEGTVVYEPRTPPVKALDKSVAMAESLMLHDVIEAGTGTAAKIPGVWAAGKTGTTQSYRDAWFVGYAENLVTSVWVGYREGQVDMVSVHGIKVTGGSFPAQLWRSYTQTAVSHQRSPVTPGGAAPSGEAPAGTVEVSICPDSMLLANKRCPAPVSIYLDSGLVPSSACGRH
ncbi:MAG: transglycosylase domain-containing protein [Coriobacteriia bacterium]